MSLQKREAISDPIAFFADLDGSGPPVGAKMKQWWDLPLPGSGGHIRVRPRFRRELTGTGGKIRLVEVRATPRKQADTTELLRLVRSVLSLNITELAGSIGVERPTVYAWLAGKSRPQSVNRKRLEELATYARHWKRIGKRPLGRRVRDPLSAGTTIVELLQRDAIPQAQVIEQLQRLALLGGGPRRVRPAREVALSLGVAELDEDEIDVATGKRFDAD